MALILPVLDRADHSFVTAVEDARYRFRLRWNTRTACWYLAVENSSEEVITSFEKILPNIPLILHNQSLFPKGNVYAIHTSNLDGSLPITRDNLGVGKEYQLMYIADSELEET